MTIDARRPMSSPRHTKMLSPDHAGKMVHVTPTRPKSLSELAGNGSDPSAPPSRLTVGEMTPLTRCVSRRAKTKY